MKRVYLTQTCSILLPLQARHVNVFSPRVGRVSLTEQIAELDGLFLQPLGLNTTQGCGSSHGELEGEDQA